MEIRLIYSEKEMSDLLALKGYTIENIKINDQFSDWSKNDCYKEIYIAYLVRPNLSELYDREIEEYYRIDKVFEKLFEKLIITKLFN